MTDDPLKTITADQFLTLGMNQVAYMRSFTRPEGEQPYYAVHAADGTPMFIADGLEAALGRLTDKSMHAIPLH